MAAQDQAGLKSTLRLQGLAKLVLQLTNSVSQIGMGMRQQIQGD